MLYELPLTEWLPWEERNSVPSTPGIYVIARGTTDNVVYIGRTWADGGLRGRLRAFHRSSTTGQKGHAGGVTFHRLFGPDQGQLFTRVHTALAINPDPKILQPYLDYAERRLIWEFVAKAGELPVCNSE